MTEKRVLLDRKQNLYLKNTARKGRGLFCSDSIAAGEELEFTPALILHEQDNLRAEKTILNNYVFTTGKISKKMQTELRIKKPAKTSCIVMGIASYCNHDETPNAEVVWQERNGTLYYILQATADIPPDTEICTSYGDDWFDNRDA